MNKTKIASLLLGSLLMIYAAAFAGGEQPIPVNEIKLDNGLTVLVVERHSAPVFTGYICIGTGSAYEKVGSIGTAHFLEHMMFKGSETVGTSDIEAEKKLWIKEDSIWAQIDRADQETQYIRMNNPEKLDEHLQYIESLNAILDSLSSASSKYTIPNEFDQIYTRNGSADFNAWTSYDITNYHVSLPANRLELWFNMESDRLKHPALREFFSERDVIGEERRLSVENNSESKLFEQLIANAFMAHPYQIYWEWQSEIMNLSRQDLNNFINKYYTPDNIALAIVGDVKVDEVKKLAQKYFGDFPKRGSFEPIYTVEPEQLGERRVDVHYDANPAVYIAYHKTAIDSPDEPTFKVIARLIGDGRTSRLYKSLVTDRQLALTVQVDFFPGETIGDKYPGIINIYAEPKEGVTTAQLEQAIYEELDKLAKEPIDEKELAKIKNNINADYVWATYSNFGLAYRLAVSQVKTKNWRQFFDLEDRLLAVTPDDIQRVAGEYLTGNNRTVATLIPIEKGADQ